MSEFLKGVWGVCLYCGESVGKVDVEEEGVEGVRDGGVRWRVWMGKRVHQRSRLSKLSPTSSTFVA